HQISVSLQCFFAAVAKGVVVRGLKVLKAFADHAPRIAVFHYADCPPRLLKAVAVAAIAGPGAAIHEAGAFAFVVWEWMNEVDIAGIYHVVCLEPPKYTLGLESAICGA